MLAFNQNLPGIDAAVETTENEFMWGPNGPLVITGGPLASTTVDAGSSPTTQLRQGLWVGKISASGLWTHYDPAATDGSQEPLGILLEAVNMYDANAGAARQKSGKFLLWGNYKGGQTFGLDEYARGRTSKRLLADDLRQHELMRAQTKAASYTVVAADNGSHFFTLGASGAVVFTLPAVANCRGYRFRFSNVVDQNMTITAPAGLLVTFNNAAATSVAFSTSGQKIGASVEIVGLPDSSKYLVLAHGANTMTVA